MKNLSIILACILVAMMSCTKSKEVHPEIGDGNDEIVTVGMRDVHVEYTRTDHAELSRVVFHYCPANANGNTQQFEAAEMTKKETFFELVLDDLLCDTLYWYYYELFPISGDAFTTAQKTFHTQACEQPEPPTPPLDHEYVDLGLPSGLLWATCNVGANSPEEYGDYFAWGETQPKNNYTWDTYKYCNGSYGTLTKYCSVSGFGHNGFADNLVSLLPEDDAATANWGNGWRMPTIEEWQELCDNTTVIWTIQDGVNGELFTASNGNSIFMPAAGIRLNNSLELEGCDGNYWSSSLFIGDPNSAWRFDFHSDTYFVYYGDRYCGNSVRPVRGGSVPTPPTPPNDAPEGAINGLFTINENGDKVYFSQGNLQYQASTNTWRFAEHQWDFVGTQTPDPVLGIMGGTVSGSDNYNISSTYDGWIDLYGWGTSGWDSGNIYYHPWDTTWSIDNCHDFYGPYGNHNLTGLYAHADWGVHNSISNGGNTAETWRTLKKEEWRYLFNDRNTPSGIRFARANVCGINGLVLVPDNWSEDIFVLNNVNSSGYNHFSDNLITESQWMLLEDAGVLFLPAAGSRGDTDPFPGFVILNAGNQGHYWSSSNYGNEAAYLISFGEYWVETYYGLVRSYGFSVRLVQDASK